MTFPIITADNQTHVSGGITYKSVLAQNRWRRDAITAAVADASITTAMLAAQSVTPTQTNLSVTAGPTPPGAPATGTTYLITSPATGAWAGHENELATWDGTTWTFTPPYEGLVVWDPTANKLKAWDGAAWAIVGPTSASGITAGSIGSTELADGAVTTVKIADANVTTAKLADDSVTSAKIADGTIATADIADSAITTAKLADNSVTSAKIADGSIVAADIADGTITQGKLAPGVGGAPAWNGVANPPAVGSIFVAQNFTSTINAGATTVASAGNSLIIYSVAGGADITVTSGTYRNLGLCGGSNALWQRTA